MRPERFELPTTWFEAKCSIQMSYGRSAEYLLRVLKHSLTPGWVLGEFGPDLFLTVCSPRQALLPAACVLSAIPPEAGAGGTRVGAENTRAAEGAVLRRSTLAAPELASA